MRHVFGGWSEKGAARANSIMLPNRRTSNMHFQFDGLVFLGVLTSHWQTFAEAVAVEVCRVLLFVVAGNSHNSSSSLSANDDANAHAQKPTNEPTNYRPTEHPADQPNATICYPTLHNRTTQNRNPLKPLMLLLLPLQGLECYWSSPTVAAPNPNPPPLPPRLLFAIRKSHPLARIASTLDSATTSLPSTRAAAAAAAAALWFTLGPTTAWPASCSVALPSVPS